MSHPLPDPLPIGSLALTLKRADPRNAGLVVEILAHVGPVPEWRIEDGYRVRRIDGQAIPSSITYGADGQITDANASGQLVAIQDRRYLQPLNQNGNAPSCVRFLRRPVSRVKGNPIFPTHGNRKFPTLFKPQPLPDGRGRLSTSLSAGTSYRECST